MWSTVKSNLLSFAELVDAYRVFPRTFLAYYGYLLLDAHYWYIHLEVPLETQTDYLQWLWGAAGVVTVFYLKSGRNWGS